MPPEQSRMPPRMNPPGGRRPRPGPPGPGSPGPDQKPRFPSSSVIGYIIMMLILLWVWQEYAGSMVVKAIPYSQFKQYVSEGRISQCTVGPDDIRGTVLPAKTAAKAATTQSAATRPAAKAGTAAAAQEKAFQFRTVRVNDPKLVSDLEAAHVKFTGVRPSMLSQLLWAWILPIGAILALWYLMTRRMGGVGQGILNIGKSKARLVAEDTGVTFADVAGVQEAKADLREIVEFLKMPERFRSLGAQIPRGALLIGPPGTGKTLLARAVAGEAHVPFFSINGSDFVEMFVGIGAARVRDMFNQAKASAPCIVFIDEIDAVGGRRGAHLGMVNDEREQTLNQLLAEMDGFAPNQGIIILAATNRPEVLDPALLRPGRFDRQILVDAPDLDGRQAILKVHARNKQLADDVDLREIAQQTPGFSGADLANALNEAAILAARRQAPRISQHDIQEAVEKVVAGPERKSRRLNPEEKRRVAFHEVGHALVAAFSPHADQVHKISIVPRGRAALGYTMQLPEGDRFLLTQAELIDRIRGMLGGRAAEEIVFNEISTGAENDLEHATSLARQMVCLFGMGQSAGLMHCGNRQESVFLNHGQPALSLQRDCSEQTARQIDDEVKQILDEAYVQAKSLLVEHRADLDHIAAELLERESLDRQEFEQLLHRGKASSPQGPTNGH